MNKSLIALVLMVPILTFAIIVWLTMAKIVTGGALIAIWIIGFVLATLATTAIMTIVQLNKYKNKEDED
ncbi:hypothetical protein FC26_GL000911 [Paucilactobacillus vaccinostercus DSM 20634]|jgi:hypothetical protein|uniref:Uncharacterized protein n=1 Tax=Paucilactobacillus vaccinostercus DSM 20634 TaxID=1423813 RepID=A0A0R2A3Y6_9LACO|nr:hypothetical protein [Paucilactobacillus vaccinostercus]KRM60276.1 hypothetical protein FC26_GL000911 [Paucilactobacillus vaccinostercus DSM 20634]RRG08704.1 MAG: hypothetical protein DUD32_09475 [Lactobacillus sp.]